MNWLHNVSDIEPGNSAVLSQNLIAFYGIHSVAISLISTSLVACSIVIISILCCSRKDRWDFPERFPLYLAIADMLWGMSHLADHLVLLTTKTYPSVDVGTVLSINLWVFLGYQQMMHAGLATYTYLRIVRDVSLDLGKGEWKLHLFCFGVMGLSVALFYPLGSFGGSGYWYLNVFKTKEGRFLGICSASSTTILALCTTIGYRSVIRVVEKRNETMKAYEDSTNLTNWKSSTLHSTATERLNTFVLIAVGLYTPFAIGAWALIVEVCVFDVIEPVTILSIVITANCSGWANALGYFRNNQIKARREAERRKYSLIRTISASNSNSNPPLLISTDKDCNSA